MGHKLRSRRWAGVWRAMRMAALVPLLVVLWGAQARAVTLEGSGAVRAAALCVAAAQGLPSPAELAGGPGVPGAGATEVSGAEGDGLAPAWARPDLSRESVLRLARTAADRSTSPPAVAPLGDDWCALARAALRGPEPEATMVDKAPLSRPSVVEESLGPWSGGSCAAPGPSRQVVGPSLTAAALRWWHSVPLLPGLLAVGVAVRGIVRNRSSQLLVRC